MELGQVLEGVGRKTLADSGEETFSVFDVAESWHCQTRYARADCTDRTPQLGLRQSRPNPNIDTVGGGRLIIEAEE